MACASIIGFPDVPDIADAGAPDGGSGPRPGASSGSSAGSSGASSGSSASSSGASGTGPGGSSGKGGGGTSSGSSSGGVGSPADAGSSGTGSGDGSSNATSPGSSSGSSGLAGATDSGADAGPSDPGLGCDIGGVSYAPAAKNPSNPCQTCQPGWRSLAWSDACASGTCVAGSCVTMASCASGGAGQDNCGAAGESCCASPAVAGGTFYRTYSNAGAGATGLADPATVSSFRLDKYEVTVGRFRRFVAAWNGGAGYVPPPGSGMHTHVNGGSGLNAITGGYEPGWMTRDNYVLAPTDADLACSSSYTAVQK
jgi:sulfatase modifying factor 1